MEKSYSQRTLDIRMLADKEEVIEYVHRDLSQALGTFLMKEGKISFVEEDTSTVYEEMHTVRASVITATEEEFKEYKAMKRFFDEHVEYGQFFEVWKTIKQLRNELQNELNKEETNEI